MYAAANQTPTASPDIDRGIAPSIPIVAQDQDPSEYLRSIEENPMECRERSSTNTTIDSRGPLITYLAGVSTNHGQQGESLMQHSEFRGLEKEEDIAGKPAYITNFLRSIDLYHCLNLSSTTRNLKVGLIGINWRRLLTPLLKIGSNLSKKRACSYNENLKQQGFTLQANVFALQRNCTPRASRLYPKNSH